MMDMMEQEMHMDVPTETPADGGGPVVNKSDDKAISRRAVLNRIPPDKTIVEMVKAGMAAFPIDARRASKVACINAAGYMLIRKLLLLQEQEHRLSVADRVKIKFILSEVERTRTIAGTAKMAEEVLRRCWMNKKPADLYKQKKRFESTLIHIQESCESTSHMTIPHDLDITQRDGAIVVLTASVKAIVELIGRLAGATQEEVR